MGFVIITAAWIVIFVFPVAIAILVTITLWITIDALKLLKDQEEQYLRTKTNTEEERLKRQTQILFHSKFSYLLNISYFMHNIDELYELNEKLKSKEKKYGSCLREEKAKISSIKLQIEKLIQNLESDQKVEGKPKNFKILINMKGSIDKLEKNIDKLLHDLPTFQN
jgi:hypothetical protein